MHPFLRELCSLYFTQITKLASRSIRRQETGEATRSEAKGPWPGAEHQTRGHTSEWWGRGQESRVVTTQRPSFTILVFLVLKNF